MSIPSFPQKVTHRTSDSKRSADTEHQSQDAAIELPQSILESISPQQLPAASTAVCDGALVREQAINDKSVYPYYNSGTTYNYHDELGNGYSLMYGIWVV